jgi:predicted TIM-barrel fold metal-dependent hydrolase
MMETFALVAAALAAVTAFLIGARRIVGEFATAARRQGRVDQALMTVDRELTVNGNGSLKSRVVRLGAQLDQALELVETYPEFTYLFDHFAHAGPDVPTDAATFRHRSGGLARCPRWRPWGSDRR